MGLERILPQLGLSQGAEANDWGDGQKSLMMDHMWPENVENSHREITGKTLHVLYKTGVCVSETNSGTEELGESNTMVSILSQHFACK